MKLLLTRETSIIHKYLDGCDLKILFVDEIYGREGEGSLWKMSKDEYWADQIIKKIDIEELTNLDTIIIDKEQDTQGYYKEILLAGHLAFHHFKTIPENSFSIILTGESHLRPDQLRNSPVIDFFALRGTSYSTYSDFFSKKYNPVFCSQEYGFDQIVRQLDKINWKEFYVPYNRDDRHQISNEWGALRLAANAGFEQDEINYDYPATLFFKFLTRKYQNNVVVTEKICFGSHPALRNKKILLIDDNADKGWQTVMEKIFEPAKVDVAEDFEKVNQFGNLKDLSPYDIIFLDLRLPKIGINNIDYDNGIKLLQKIKESYPQVPVIVFTASNKSWTRETVQNFGADGMYVKESPEYAGDQYYSKENFINFEKSVSETLEKYKVLRPYWEAIQKILKDQTFLSIPEKRGSNFKYRIEERLMMFYGLLKRGFEQTEFNEKQFHFSDNELAFMTLWSTLNEISEANYNKSQPKKPIQDSAGNLVTNHPGRQPITYNQNHFKWEIIGQSDTYVEYAYSTIIDANTGHHATKNSGRFYKLNHEQKSCFLFDNNQFQIVSPIKTKANYETTLFLQIAYLIEKKANLSTSTNKSNFQQTLVRLNEVRNHLYLTHGSDISSGFYDQTEKAKRVNHTINPNGDIKDLFELISFLLTGKENKVDIY